MRSRHGARRGASVGFVAVVATVAVLGGACADERDDVAAPPPTPQPPAFAAPAELSADAHGLTATLEQYREDEVANRISIKITNGGEEQIVVKTLRLSWPGLTDTEPSTPEYAVFPGTRVDLRAPLGEAVCSSPALIDEPVPDLPIAAIAETSDGEITFAVTDPLGVLGRIYPRQCTRQSVERAVAITIGDEWADRSADPAELAGILRVERRNAVGEVRVKAIFGSVLVRMSAPDAPATLAADEEVLEVPIVATNNRCDSHALGEAKKPYVFLLDLTIDGRDVPYVVSPGDGGKAALAAGIIDRCPPDTDP